MVELDRHQGKHPIQVVARRSGLTPDVLRAWEKRYGAVVPKRSSTGRRLYSDADIDRLRLIREVIDGGRRIGDVAKLAVADLEAMVEEDRAQSSPALTRVTVNGNGDDFVGEAIAAVRDFDSAGLRAVLNKSLIALSPHQFIDDVATPLMQHIGDLWARGELRPGHEHLATDVMRQVLGDMLETLQPDESTPQIIIATPSGQRHELGALLAGTAACLEGWRVTYLGPDLPGADIGEAAVSLGADAIALSITAPDASAVEQIEVLRQRVGRDVPILIGGQGADVVTEAVHLRVTRLRGVASLRAVLGSLQPAR